MIVLSPDEKAAQQAELDQEKADLESRQEQLEENIQELLEQMEKLAQEQSSDNEQVSEGLKEALKQAEREKLSESLEESLKQLQSGQLQQAQQSQKKTSQSLSQMQMNLSSLMESMGGMDFQRDLVELRRALDRLLLLSERQEKVVGELSPGGYVLRAWPSNLKNEVSILQNYYRDEILRIEEHLRELGKKDPFLDFKAIQELRLAARAMDRSANIIENELPNQGAALVPQVKSQAQLGLDKINTAVLILLDNLESMAQAQASSSMESYFNSLEQLTQQQQQLNQRTRQQQQMRKRGQVPNWQQQMQQLSKEQAAIRRKVQELFRKYGKMEELLGKLDEVGNQMMDVEKDLEDQNADEKVQEKQQEILTRLLDAEKSVQEQGESKKRESETAGAYEAESSPELPESLESVNSRIQKLRQGVGEDQVPPEFRQRVRSYFERLAEEQ